MWKPSPARVIADSTGVNGASSDYGNSVNTQDGPLYCFVNCCNLSESSSSAAFCSCSGIFSVVDLRQIGSSNILTGLLPPAVPPNMYPVTCQWSHFIYPTETQSGLTTLQHRSHGSPPTANPDFPRGPRKHRDRGSGSVCCLGRKYRIKPCLFSYFGAIQPVGCLL